MSCKSVPQEFPTRVSHKSVPQECPTRVPYKSVPQECPTRVSHKSVLQEYPTRVSYKSVPQECPARVSHKSIQQECPTRVSHKSVPQECPTRVSYKSVPQECPTRVAHKSAPEECPTRVSYKSVIWTYVACRTCLHSGSWAPSCFFQSPEWLRLVSSIVWSQRAFGVFQIFLQIHQASSSSQKLSQQANPSPALPSVEWLRPTLRSAHTSGSVCATPAPLPRPVR